MGVPVSWLRPIDQWFVDQIFVYQAQHRSYAYRLTRNPEEAEDLVQEAYARLFRLDNWAEIANPHAFTMRIIHNEAMERFRKAPGTARPVALAAGAGARRRPAAARSRRDGAR